MDDDKYHAPATRYFHELLAEGARLLTSHYVLDETLTRLRYDLGHAPTMEFWTRLEQAQQRGILVVLPVDQATWSAAFAVFRQYDDQLLSFSDCTSFVMAERERVSEVFAFDRHFLIFGLTVKPGM